MPADTTSNTPGAKSRHDWLPFLLCLLAVLGALFHRSFQADQVLFSNDGPLGAANAQGEYAWKNLLGYWQDLNWLGMKYPSGFLSFGYLTYALLGPLAFSKFIVPLSLLILGASSWLFFRQLGFHPVACLLGGIAAALNMDAFSVSCWGLSGWTLSRASIFLALAALPNAQVRSIWIRAALAGMAVGMALMDGLDVGAIFSLYVAAYVFFQAFLANGATTNKCVSGFARVALVAICATLIAAQALITLIGTQVKGIAGMAQDQQTKEARWVEATSASLAKVEALRIIIPGVFGYRMPELYGEPAESANGSNYWGAMGQTPGVPQSRHSGGGEFAGVLVTLIAVWACAQSFRKKNNPFTENERKTVWFWGGATIVSLLLAFGKYTPIYRFVYALPYFSTIRNPFKFLHPLHVALAILFAYGVQGLYRRFLLSNAKPAQSMIMQLKSWWRSAPSFDRKWVMGSVAAIILSLLGWLVYASSKNELIHHLQQIGFPDGELAASIARFSLNEVGQFVLILLLSVGVLTLILCGAFSGHRVKWAGVALGVLLVIDLSRADTPWIVYYNFKEKYATSTIIEKLREKSYENRVTAELLPLTRAWLATERGQFFGAFYYEEWLQHHFQYYRVQSLDIIQLPRQPEFDKAYMTAFRPPEVLKGGPVTLENFMSPMGGRLWQLTNTRYILGMTGFLESLNQRIDPGRQRFRVHTAFNLVPKPGLASAKKVNELTAVADRNGPFALFEFTGALPRAKLYGQWQVSTNDETTLQKLAGTEFDPDQTVLVASDLSSSAATSGTNQSPGDVAITHYEPKIIRLNADANAACVLLLNDRHDPDWKVFVDGKPEPVLRCNYIMQGVYLAPGKHLVEFRFEPSRTAFYVSLTMLLIGMLLCGFLAIPKRKTESSPKPSAKK